MDAETPSIKMRVLLGASAIHAKAVEVLISGGIPDVEGLGNPGVGSDHGEWRAGVDVDGEILHRVRLDAHGLVGGLSVEERGRGGDIDLFVDCADLQGNAQLGGFIGAQRDTLLDEFLESGGFHGEFVGTGKQLGESVAARAACYCSPLLIGCGIGEQVTGVAHGRPSRAHAL